MLKKYFALIPYSLAVISFILFFLSSFFSEPILDVFVGFFAATIVTYFASMFIAEIDNTFEFFADILLFFSMNIVGLGSFECLLTFIPYSLELILINILLSLIYCVAFGFRLFSYWKYCENKKKEKLVTNPAE